MRVYGSRWNHTVLKETLRSGFELEPAIGGSKWNSQPSVPLRTVKVQSMNQSKSVPHFTKTGFARATAPRTEVGSLIIVLFSECTSVDSTSIARWRRVWTKIAQVHSWIAPSTWKSLESVQSCNYFICRLMHLFESNQQAAACIMKQSESLDTLGNSTITESTVDWNSWQFGQWNSHQLEQRNNQRLNNYCHKLNDSDCYKWNSWVLLIACHRISTFIDSLRGCNQNFEQWGTPLKAPSTV